MRSMRMLIKSVFKASVSRRKRERRITGGKNARAGHVTPSFLTDDEEEFQSNIDLGKSRLIFEFYLDISPSHYGVT